MGSWKKWAVMGAVAILAVAAVKKLAPGVAAKLGV